MSRKALSGSKACPALSRTLLSPRVPHFFLGLFSHLPFTGLRCQAFNVMSLEMLPISLASRDASSLMDLKTALDNVGEFKIENSCLSHFVFSV